MRDMVAMIKSKFPKKLQYQLRDKNISTMELAHTLGVSKQTVNGWIKGKFNPQLMHIYMVAHYFKINASDLI